MIRFWFKFCANCAGSCVAIRDNGDGTFTLRNSNDPAETISQATFSETELNEFATGWVNRDTAPTEPA